jgi:hypothetical protein
MLPSQQGGRQTHHLPRILVMRSGCHRIRLLCPWRSQLPCQFDWFDDADWPMPPAAQRATQDLPALILLDPRSCFGTEGYELLRTLCVYQQLAQIPLVLFTGALSADFAQEQDSRIWYAAKPVRTADMDGHARTAAPASPAA